MGSLQALDLFCGYGGFGLAFKESGIKVVKAYDWKSIPVESYNHNIGNHAEVIDIRKLKGEDLPRTDVWSFGFPCQDLSKAGKMAGMKVTCNDCKEEYDRAEFTRCIKCSSEEYTASTRSGLFFEVMRLLKQVKEKPRVILAENVNTLRKYFGVMEEEYEKAGYTFYAPPLYTSKYWGVPQARERYFVVGIRKDIDKVYKYPEESKEVTCKLLDILEENPDPGLWIDDIESLKIVEKHKDHFTVRQATKKGYVEAYYGDTINVSHPTSKTRRGRWGNQIAQTLLTSRDQVVVSKRDGELALRWLSPREYCRLQGFPDSYKLAHSDNQSYFGLGNAITVNVGAAVIKSIKTFLEEYEEEPLKDDE